jgi:hypothetical protein
MKYIKKFESAKNISLEEVLNYLKEEEKRLVENGDDVRLVLYSDGSGAVTLGFGDVELHDFGNIEELEKLMLSVYTDKYNL